VKRNRIIRIIKFLSVLNELFAVFCLEMKILSKNGILKATMSEILERAHCNWQAFLFKQ